MNLTCVDGFVCPSTTPSIQIPYYVILVIFTLCGVSLQEIADVLLLWYINYYLKAEVQTQTAHRGHINFVYKMTFKKDA